MTDLENVEEHFEFGRNWRSYAAQLTASEIDDATRELGRLLATESLAGRSFLDIGCGSGIHSLAALRLGAERVVALDIDADSVETTRQLLATHAPGHSVDVRLASILKDDIAPRDSFEIVYSWGVLHHTGNLREALRRTAALVKPGGTFAFALYRRTLCCPLWTIEKRWYRDAGERGRRFARETYVAFARLGLLLTGHSYSRYVAQYPLANRGMDFRHDVHDWLGGFPYESISASEVESIMTALDFSRARSRVRSGPLLKLGLLGSGCDEYVYRRTGSHTAQPD